MAYKETEKFEMDRLDHKTIKRKRKQVTDVNTSTVKVRKERKAKRIIT